jgi:hypothetical protein
MSALISFLVLIFFDFDFYIYEFESLTERESPAYNKRLWSALRQLLAV